MATSGTIRSTTTPNSKKVDSLTVLRRLEVQGTMLVNAIESAQDNLSWFAVTPSADGAGAAIPNGAYTKLIYATNTDTSGAEAAGVYTTPVSGLYLVTGHIEFAANAVGQRGFQIFESGASELCRIQVDAASAGTTALSIAHVFDMAAAFQFQMQAFQSSGGPLAISSGRLSVILLRRTA